MKASMPRAGRSYPRHEFKPRPKPTRIERFKSMWVGLLLVAFNVTLWVVLIWQVAQR